MDIYQNVNTESEILGFSFSFSLFLNCAALMTFVSRKQNYTNQLHTYRMGER